MFTKHCRYLLVGIVYFFGIAVTSLADEVPRYEARWLEIPSLGTRTIVIDFKPGDLDPGRKLLFSLEGKDYLYVVNSSTEGSSPDVIKRHTTGSFHSVELGPNGEVITQSTPLNPETLEPDLSQVTDSASVAQINPTDSNPSTSLPVNTDSRATIGSFLSDTLGAFGENAAGAAETGVQAGLVSGLSVYAYQKLVYGDSYMKKFDALAQAQEKLRASGEEDQKKITEYINQSAANVNATIASLETLRSTIDGIQTNISLGNTGGAYSFKSTDANFVNELSDIRKTLLSSNRSDIQGINIRNTGLKFTELADESHSNNELDDANAFKSFAYAAADLLFGIDPITGTGRDIYEGFTGYNMITGEKLSGLERGFSIAGMVSFGYGSKIGKGLLGISKIAKAFKNSKTVQKAINHARTAFTTFANSTIYRKSELWKTERYLNKQNPNLLVELRNHPKGDQYLKYIKDRKDIKIFHPYKEEFITQDLSVDALETIDRISSKQWVARQGRFGMEKNEIVSILKKNPTADSNSLKFGSRITIGSNPADQSVFFGEITDRLGSLDYSLKHGAYSDGIDFVELSKLKPDAVIITRKAEGGTAIDAITGKEIPTPGGAIEVIVKQGDIDKSRLLILDEKSTLKETQSRIVRIFD